MSGEGEADSALHEKRFELFKFYEEASQRTKADAWTQTTWVLTLSGAILAFSVEAWLEHPARQGLATITWAAAVAGVILLLNLPPLLFAAGHVAWAIHVASQLPA